MRAVLVALLTAVALLAIAAPAGAATNDLERGRAEIDRASALVDDAKADLDTAESKLK